MLALRPRGRHGLFFIDGHADFYQPEASTTGEVADMDLAIVSGRGPTILTDIEGRNPLVRDEDIVAFGQRDAEEASEAGSQNIAGTGIHALDLASIHAAGVSVSAECGLAFLSPEVAGFWIHLDADVLDDAIMPAVDYRLAGGLTFNELSKLLRILIRSNRAVGMSVAIFNPTLDPDGEIAASFVRCLTQGLVGG